MKRWACIGRSTFPLPNETPADRFRLPVESEEEECLVATRVGSGSSLLGLILSVSDSVRPLPTGDWCWALIMPCDTMPRRLWAFLTFSAASSPQK
jgi:hypothetical protein